MSGKNNIACEATLPENAPDKPPDKQKTQNDDQYKGFSQTDLHETPTPSRWKIGISMAEAVAVGLTVVVGLWIYMNLDPVLCMEMDAPVVSCGASLAIVGISMIALRIMARITMSR